MRITSRLIGSLVSLITLVVVGYTVLQARQERVALEKELRRSAMAFAEPLQDVVVPALRSHQTAQIDRLVRRFERRPTLGIAIFDSAGRLLGLSPALKDYVPQAPGSIERALTSGNIEESDWRSESQRLYGMALPLRDEKSILGAVLIVQNANHVDERIQQIWKYGFLRLLLQSFFIAMATLFIIRWNVTGPLVRVTEWLQKIRRGELDPVHRESLPKDVFGPLANEVSNLAHSLSIARAAAEEEARLRQSAESLWTAERLREHARSRLQGRPLFVISNREPWMHTRKGKTIEAIVPASGLVTAIEPILKACGGTWIAHGAGDADRDVVDSNDRIRVPPEEPQYTLRRVWLSKEEEAGYYFGFSNEGLWPLCHIAHTRPLFRAQDWNHYREVNTKFAEAALEEMRDTEEPWLLIQDYHFALLPRLIKEKRPDARVAVFWHIPWPNPESFGICPWQRDILQGLLGADLLGFHTQFHCNNFLDTVDRALESNIDWERFAVTRRGHTTWVKPFPISVDFTGPKVLSLQTGTETKSKAALLKELGIKAEFMAVGVDRIDYTKGIVERFHGIERFLEKFPTYQGRFTFVELGAPSRTLIKRYHDLIAEVESEADRINWRFKARDWKPIVLLKRHHSHADIEPFYRAADVCLVTSLHDGMNLVAKEFVSMRDDEDGVLILSRFTGASREMRDALLVNPYDSDQLAEAMRLSIEMPFEERRTRMQHLRGQLRDWNIFRWGADMLSALAEIRLPATPHGERVS